MAIPVATHSMILILRRTVGSAHTLSGSQAFSSSRWRRKNPSPRKAAVPPRTYGRIGSNVAESPAPDTPTVTARSGPAQQSAEPNAVTMPPSAVNSALPNLFPPLHQDQEGASLRSEPTSVQLTPWCRVKTLRIPVKPLTMYSGALFMLPPRRAGVALGRTIRGPAKVPPGLEIRE